MGPIVRLKITFDNPQEVFETGRAVTGHVHVIVEEKDGAKIRGVKIEWKGETKTNFRSGGQKYSQKETYIENEMYIMGSSDRSKPHILLQEGTHAIPFSIFLPPNIPGTYEHSHGFIAYEVYAKVNFPYNLFDPHVTTPFKVTKVLVLSGNLLNPIQPVLEDRIGLFCINKGEVSTTLGLPRTGFLPGEELQFSLIVENQSSKEIESVCVQLVQYTTFHGKRRTTSKNRKTNAPLNKDIKVTSTWGSIDFPPIKPHDTFERMNNVIALHSEMISSNLIDCCSIIRTSYELQVCFSFGFPYPKKKRTIPITIGSTFDINRAPQPASNGPNIFIQSNPSGPYPPTNAPVYPGQTPYIPPPGYAPVPMFPQPSNSFAPNFVPPTAPSEPYSPPPPYNPMPPDYKN